MGVCGDPLAAVRHGSDRPHRRRLSSHCGASINHCDPSPFFRTRSKAAAQEKLARQETEERSTALFDQGVPVLRSPFVVIRELLKAVPDIG